MSDSTPKVNAFSAPTSKNTENKIDQLKKYKIIIPILFVVSLVIGLGGYFYYRSTALQSLQQQEDTFASIPSGLEISPTSGNWNVPLKLRVTNKSTSTKTVSWFLDCWDEKVCQDSVGKNVLQPNESFEQGLGEICSKWQLDLTTQSVTPAWNSPDDIPDNYQWEWGGVAEKKAYCNQSPSPSATATASPTVSPSGSPRTSKSPSPSPTHTSSPSATVTASPTASASTTASASSTASPSPSVTASASSTSNPTSTPTSTPAPSSSPSEVANATTNQPSSTNPPTQVASVEQLPKAGIDDTRNLVLGLALFSVIAGLLFSKLKKRLY
jgi:hypothetical protein